MTLSIPFPAIPIKLTVGKEKKEDAPIVKTAPASQPSALGDIAMLCVSAVAIVAIVAILIMAMRQGLVR